MMNVKTNEIKYGARRHPFYRNCTWNFAANILAARDACFPAYFYVRYGRHEKAEYQFKNLGSGHPWLQGQPVRVSLFPILF